MEAALHARSSRVEVRRSWEELRYMRTNEHRAEGLRVQGGEVKPWRTLYDKLPKNRRERVEKRVRRRLFLIWFKEQARKILRLGF